MEELEQEELKPTIQDVRKSEVVNKQGVVTNTEMWTDLYRPQSIGDLVGNEGVIDSLYEWLKDWDDVVLRGNKKEVTMRKGQSWQDAPKPNARATMLSGPPGIGKTSTARIVCKQLGYEVLETNASDTRSKNAISLVLTDLSSNQSLDYFSVTGLKH